MTYSPFIPKKDIGATGNLSQTLNDTVEFDNDEGFVSLGMFVTPPTGGEVTFEGTLDGTNLVTFSVRSMELDRILSTVTTATNVIGSIATFRKIRLRTSVGGSADGDAVGRMSRDAAVLETIEFGAPPHKIGFDPVHEDAIITTATTTDLWDPATGKTFVATDLIVAINATPAASGFITVFDETDADGNRLFRLAWDTADGAFFVHIPFTSPYVSNSSGNILKVLTSVAFTMGVHVHGYEI